MQNDTLMVFTRISTDTMLREGGSRAWKLDPNRARQLTYIVCTRNSRNAESGAREPHGHGFLVARISDVVQWPAEPDRYIVKFDSYAFIDKPNLWDGTRIPTRYTTLHNLGIDNENLVFHRQPDVSNSDAKANGCDGLNIQQAKPKLAEFYGVSETAVEIVIRG
jgi:hypothetical protein